MLRFRVPSVGSIGWRVILQNTDFGEFYDACVNMGVRDRGFFSALGTCQLLSS